jgi:RHS repeat-associated protein
MMGDLMKADDAACPAAPRREIAIAYDGRGRRTAITSTAAGGGSAVTATSVWCGSRMCVKSSAAGAVARRHCATGEQVLSSGSSLSYGQDQIGSTRDVLVLPCATTQAYDCNAHGDALQTPASGPLADFRFAGMFYEATSGLYLAGTRVYDPTIGRRLSREPLGKTRRQLGRKPLRLRYAQGRRRRHGRGACFLLPRAHGPLQGAEDDRVR